MKKIWSVWKSITLKIGNFQFTVIFSILYFILITPVGLLIKLLIDPLGEKQKMEWTPTKDATSTLEKMQSQ